MLLLEDNLMWSVRTRKGLEAFGHTVVVGKKPQEADLAIVNLGATSFDPLEAVKALKTMGVRTIGHIGHKEKDKWKAGEEAGCEKVVSNGTLANRLESVMKDLGSGLGTPGP